MSQQDNFSSGFVWGAMLGGLAGGLVGALLVAKSRNDELEDDLEDAEIDATPIAQSSRTQQPAKGAASRRRPLRLAPPPVTEPNMEVARRSLEDKIASLNDAIDDVRQQLRLVNAGQSEARVYETLGEEDRSAEG
jgi:hypothetical protein